MPGPGPDHKFEATGDALIQYLGLATNDLGLISIDWVRSTSDPSSAYPPNPYTMCPMIAIRGYAGTMKPYGVVGGYIGEVSYTFSVFYYKRQTLGIKSEPNIIQDMEVLWNIFSNDLMDPTRFPAVAGCQYIRVYPANVSIHSELQHEFEDPNLKVSVGELQIVFEARISTC